MTKYSCLGIYWKFLTLSIFLFFFHRTPYLHLRWTSSGTHFGRRRKASKKWGCVRTQSCWQSPRYKYKNINLFFTKYSCLDIYVKQSYIQIISFKVWLIVISKHFYKYFSTLYTNIICLRAIDIAHFWFKKRRYSL